MPWDGQCQIRYRLAGAVREWGIGCHVERDTEATIRAHLARWMPGAEYLGCRMTRVADGVAVFDTRQFQAENTPLDRA